MIFRPVACFIWLVFTVHTLISQDFEYVVFDTLDVSVHDLHGMYKPSAERTADIHHLMLEVRPDFPARTLEGRAKVIATAYNRPIASVKLDAKGMVISRVTLETGDTTRPAEYTYNGLEMHVQLGQAFGKSDTFAVIVDYLAEPYKLEDKGIFLSAGRGMYFIDPLDKNGIKPMQMWTQGETNANSVWFPVIDSPNEFFTQDISVTVADNLVTLSNGLLVESVQHGNGLRTDRWVQSLPHGPHLVFLAAGEWAVVRDTTAAVPLAYYTTPEYAPTVADVFGQTAHMMAFYGNVLGMPYPWEKYDQMVVYDFTAGAMENTTAVTYYQDYYADEFDLTDRNRDATIAHELIHHWFGDLVACESWAHLVLNEAFATYGEYLWFHHRYGLDAAERVRMDFLSSYLNEFVYKSEPIVNFFYDDAEELFDSHRYDKGAFVLHMLRDLLGDDLFFQGLNHYLTEHAFGPAEIHDFRLAMEAVSGRDLYWFFDQWFMKPGHPVVEIRHAWNGQRKEVEVRIDQIQDITQFITYRFPLSIDLYYGDSVRREQVWVDERSERFTFPSESQPDLVNADGKKIMLWEKSEDLSNREYLHLLEHGPLYADRMEALNGLRWSQNDREVRKAWLKALDDPFWDIRKFALQVMDPHEYHASEGSREKISDLALNDPVAAVRRAALEGLSNLNDLYALPVARELFATDSSRMVRAVALGILSGNDAQEGLRLARAAGYPRNFYMQTSQAGVFGALGQPEDHEFFHRALWSVRGYYARDIAGHYVEFLKRMDTPELMRAAEFLADLATYEESASMRNAGWMALNDLYDHFRKMGNANGGAEKMHIFSEAIDAVN